MRVFETIWNCRDHFDTRKKTAHVLTYLRGCEVGRAPAILDFFENKDGIGALGCYLIR